MEEPDDGLALPEDPGLEGILREVEGERGGADQMQEDGEQPVYISSHEDKKPAAKSVKKNSYSVYFYLVDKHGNAVLAATGEDLGELRTLL